MRCWSQHGAQLGKVGTGGLGAGSRQQRRGSCNSGWTLSQPEQGQGLGVRSSRDSGERTFLRGISA